MRFLGLTLLLLSVGLPTIISGGYPGPYEPSSPPALYVHDESFQPDKILRITVENYPMDCGVRYSVLINGTLPAPELRFREGDKVWIRVYNDMEFQNFTMHWHGLTQRMSPFSDGTPAASQWPIPPLHYFDYEFQLRPGDAGTYFYHSHVGLGAITAAGALIVEEKKGNTPPFTYDEERILAFTDVFQKNDSYIEDGLLGFPFRWSGETENLALNGHSRFINATKDHAGPSCSYGVISIKPDRIYRFRFIGGTALSLVFVALESHSDLTLIEVDGKYISPIKVSHLEVHTGQRYSVLFRSKSEDELNEDRKNGKTQYWIQMETRSRALITTAYAVLAYEDFSHTPDTFTPPTTKPILLPNETFIDGWIENELEPLPSHPYEDTFPLMDEVTRRVVINVQQIAFNSSGLRWIQSGSPWFEHIPHEPYLVSLYKNAKEYFPDYDRAVANGGMDPVTKTFPAKIGEVLEIVWQNVGNTAAGVTETHPFHAHGDHIWDVGTGYGYYDAVFAEKRLQDRLKNKSSPIKRDTTNLYRTPPPQTSKTGQVVSWRAWRVRVNNPGVWMMHCHILQHMVMGMQTVWVFGEKDDLTYLPKSLASGYLDFGGKAYGNDTHDPVVVHYWHD